MPAIPYSLWSGGSLPGVNRSEHTANNSYPFTAVLGTTATTQYVYVIHGLVPCWIIAGKCYVSLRKKRTLGKTVVTQLEKQKLLVKLQNIRAVMTWNVNEYSWTIFTQNKKHEVWKVCWNSLWYCKELSCACNFMRRLTGVHAVLNFWWTGLLIASVLRLTWR